MLYFNNRFAKVQPYIYELISKKVSIDSSIVDRYIKKDTKNIIFKSY